jgi:AraC-like DNA-binding protein
MATATSPPWMRGVGWQPLVSSHDFGEWDAVLANTLGHHRSRLLVGSRSFQAEIRTSRVDDFQVLSLYGTGRLELQREQCGDGVLWLPLKGLIQETINGQEYLAQPGSAVLFSPGDVMTGLTADMVSGVSILVPNRYLRGRGQLSPLLREGVAAQRLICAAWYLVEAAAMQPAGGSTTAERLVEALHHVCNPPHPDQQDERLTAARRRALVRDARSWMEQHLAERFSVVELSSALNVSVRTLQVGFKVELGCSPLAELKRMRLDQLRRLLLNPDWSDRTVAELMQEAGLLACGVTSADYQNCYGELPRRTRQLARNRL